MASLILLVGLASVFAAVALVAFTLAGAARERTQLQTSLATVRNTRIGSRDGAIAEPASEPFSNRITKPAVARFSNVGRSITPAGRIDSYSRRLEYAGSPTDWTSDRVLAAKAIGLFAGLAAGLLFSLLLGASLFWLIIITGGLTALGYFGVDLWLYNTISKRRTQIVKDLPDSLDMLTISVEAGLGFDAALAQVARNTNGPLAEEFFRVLQEMQIGVGRYDALTAMAERTQVSDIKGFVSSMVQADEFGIPVSQALRVQAKEMRVRRRQRAEERAMKIPVKILLPLILCVLPAMFVVIMGPAIISIADNILAR